MIIYDEDGIQIEFRTVVDKKIGGPYMYAFRGDGEWYKVVAELVQMIPKLSHTRKDLIQDMANELKLSYATTLRLLQFAEAHYKLIQ